MFFSILNFEIESFCTQYFMMRSLRAKNFFTTIAVFIAMLMLMMPKSSAEERVNELEYIKTYDTTKDNREVHRIEIGLKRSNYESTVKVPGGESSIMVIDMENTISGKVGRKSNKDVELSEGITNKVSGRDIMKIQEVKLNSTRITIMLPVMINENSYKVYKDYNPDRLIIDIDKGAIKNNIRDNISVDRQNNYDKVSGENVVVIDAGHGGGDSGAVGPSGLMEKTVTLDVAFKVERKLQENGISVIMTRDTDRDVSYRGSSNGTELQARVDTVPYDAKVFVSIHCNAFNNPSSNGMETYYYWNSPEGQRLAQILNEELDRYGEIANRGVRGSNFYVLKHARIGAASLVELAFITNPAEESLLGDDYYQDRLAEGITQGIIRYINGN